MHSLTRSGNMYRTVEFSTKYFETDVLHCSRMRFLRFMVGKWLAESGRPYVACQFDNVV